MKNTILLILIFTLFGCSKSIFDISNDTPIKNYNLLFEYLNNDYAYKDEHPFSMNELKARYLPEITKNPTYEKLADIIIKIENDLLDPHFQPPYETYSFSENRSPNYILKRIKAERDEKRPCFEEINILKKNEFFTYGTVKNHPTIGYIFILELSDKFGGSGRLEGNKWKEEIEPILQKLNNRNVSKIIVDIRSSAGGSNYNPLYIANRFADKTAPYMIEENEITNGEYEKITYNVKPEGIHHFREGKIALLSNFNTGSGGEMFILAMLKRDNLVHIGTPSSGCAGSIVERDLFNGWNFILTSSKTYSANGDVYFKKGIRPQIIVKNDESYGVTTFSDKLIERAIVELNKL
jgi:hypothetical protein